MAVNQQIDERRKRINLYKKIIVILILTMILLPTLLCIVLFFKINSLQKEVTELQALMNSNTAQGVTATASLNDETGHPMEPSSLIPLPETEAVSETETSTAEAGNEEMDSLLPGETEVLTEPETELFDEQALIAEALSEGRRVVYLTFDDGPSANTENLLDLLDEYEVKVTFFVNYHEGLENEYTQIVERGHTLATHSYSHQYTSVYGSYDGFVNEVESLRTYLLETFGYDTCFFRFPGGSSNSQTKIPIRTFIDYLDSKNIVYFDWNVSSGDGGSNISESEVYNNVINGVNRNEVSIVLMHDSTDHLSTYEALDDILNTLQNMNALILPITEQTVPVHHNVN